MKRRVTVASRRYLQTFDSSGFESTTRYTLVPLSGGDVSRLKNDSPVISDWRTLWFHARRSAEPLSRGEGRPIVARWTESYLLVRSLVRCPNSVDPFIWTEIRFSFGQYTALWLKLGQVYSFCEKGYIISSLRCFVGKLKAGGKTERTRTGYVWRCNNFTFKFGEQIFLPFFASPLLFSFFFRVASWNWKKEIL